MMTELCLPAAVVVFRRLTSFDCFLFEQLEPSFGAEAVIGMSVLQQLIHVLLVYVQPLTLNVRTGVAVERSFVGYDTGLKSRNEFSSAAIFK